MKRKVDSVKDLQSAFNMLDLNMDAIKPEARDEYINRMEKIYFELGRRRIGLDQLRSMERCLSLHRSSQKHEAMKAGAARIDAIAAKRGINQ
jgi:hypothetical protein